MSMGLFKGAFYLYQTELKRSMISSFLMFGLLVFCLLICSPTYMVLLGVEHPTMVARIDYLADYMFILTFCGVGVMVTFIYGAGFKKDTLADRLAYYRSLPISSEQIVLSKIMSGYISTFVLMLFFFVGNIVGFIIFSDFTVAQLDYTYIVHAILLYGIMLVSNNVFIWIDLCVSYKLYTFISFIFVFAILVITVIINVTSDSTNSLLVWAYSFSQAEPIIALVAACLLAALTTLLTFKLTTIGLRKRNLG